MVKLGMIPVPQQVVGRAALAGVDRAVATRWDAAVSRAAETVGPVEDRVDAVRVSFTKELAAVGAASGGVAALPGAGTAAALATISADIGWYSMRLADLVMTIAAIHGHERATLEERRTWVLSVLAYGDAAPSGIHQAAADVGTTLGTRQLGGLSTATLAMVNRKLTARLLTRFGARRGAATLGRLLPFGIGAAIGAGGNTFGVHTVSRHADRFFRGLPERTA
jgi:hypothetical protein